MIKSPTLTYLNVITLAFLVKDGLVRVFLGENGIPVVESVKDAEAQKSKKNLKEDDICNQVERSNLSIQSKLKIALLALSSILINC